MIAVIDYGVGNIGSVLKAFEYLEIPAKLTSDKNEIKKAERLVLPGVGAFGSGMKKLHEKDLVKVIKKEVKNGKPILGICLGLQLLFKSSEENPSISGLCLINGEVKKIEKKEVAKIPHMGWNSLEQREENELLDNLEKPRDFYFIHSYYVEPADKNLIKAETNYGNIKFASLINKNKIWGIQPHPEKSSQKGLQLLENFAEKIVSGGN